MSASSSESSAFSSIHPAPSGIDSDQCHAIPVTFPRQPWLSTFVILVMIDCTFSAMILATRACSPPLSASTMLCVTYTIIAIQVSLPHVFCQNGSASAPSLRSKTCVPGHGSSKARLLPFSCRELRIHQIFHKLLGFWFLVFGFGFLVCYTATQLATQLHQRRIQVVRSNKEARKRLTESNGTPAMDLGHMNIVLKYRFAYADIQTNEE